MELKPLLATRFSALRKKEVIDAQDGTALGQISDLELDLTGCRVTALFLPAKAGAFCLGKREDLRIPIERIEKIGEDVIFVRLPPFTSPASRQRI